MAAARVPADHRPLAGGATVYALRYQTFNGQPVVPGDVVDVSGLSQRKLLALITARWIGYSPPAPPLPAIEIDPAAVSVLTALEAQETEDEQRARELAEAAALLVDPPTIPPQTITVGDPTPPPADVVLPPAVAEGATFGEPTERTAGETDEGDEDEGNEDPPATESKAPAKTTAKKRGK